MKKFDSKKAFRLEENKVKTVGMQTVIGSVKQIIANYYDQDLSFDELLKSYQKLEYRQKHEYNFLSSMLIGILSGVIATMYINLTEAINIITVFVVPIFILFVIVGLLKIIEPSFMASSTRPYSLFIVPFEKQIIINKLQREYNFSIDNTCDEKEKTKNKQ